MRSLQRSHPEQAVGYLRRAALLFPRPWRRPGRRWRAGGIRL